MNTRDLQGFTSWDEKDLNRAVSGFVRTFHRLPKHEELLRLRRAEHRIHLRLPARGRRRIASVIATL